MSGELEITILGCGSSGGVPRGDGDWGACDPAEPRNRRTRCSMLARRKGPGGETAVLIDTSPDLREQMLAAKVRTLDAVLYTHDHADQTHGVDDLRVFVMRGQKRLPAWMDAPTRAAMTRRFGYVFESVEGYPALLEAQALPPHGETWTIEGPGGSIPVTTFEQRHGPIASVGYRLGSVVYSSDVSALPDQAFDVISGSEVWIVDALRWTPHPTHANVDRSLEWIARSGVPQAVLTNLHLDLNYNDLQSRVPDNVKVAFDGLSLKAPV